MKLTDEYVSEREKRKKSISFQAWLAYCVCRRLTNPANQILLGFKRWQKDCFLHVPSPVTDSQPSAFITLWWNFILGGVFYPNWHQRRKAGPKPPLRLQEEKKSHHQPLSFCIWTTLQCPLPVDSFCWCHSIVCRPLISMRTKSEGDWEWGDGNGEPAEEARVRHRAGFYLQLLDHWLISLTQVRLLPVLRAQSGMWSFRNWCDSMYIFELYAHYWICRSLMNAKHRSKCNVLSINLLLMALEGSVEGLLIS